jgi:hypothetical protein
MPGNRRVKYFHKCIVEYIDIGRGFMPGNRRVKYFHKCIVEYIDIGGASCPGIKGLNISTSVL